jgi:hypothetical protein
LKEHQPVGMLPRFVDSRLLNAIVLVVLGITIPLAFPIGGAAAGMVTLRRGPQVGFLVAAAGWGSVMLLTTLLGAEPGFESLLPMLMLAAVVGVSWVLRITTSLAMAVSADFAIALLALMVFMVVVDDPVIFWRNWFENVFDQLEAAGGTALAESDRREFIESLPLQAISGHAVTSFCLVCMWAVFLGRSWQARLVNPGGFQREFHQMQLGRGLAIATAGVFMLAAWYPFGWLLSTAVLLMMLWIVQGLSVIHSLVAGYAMSAGWLMMTYVGIFVGWPLGIPVILIVPLVGLVNQFFDIRARMHRNKSE